MTHVLSDNSELISNRSIHLNADLGEHDGQGYTADAALLDLVSSANICCGAHAGSEDVMLQTVRNALERGVRIGAHPGYPDREGFGRRETTMPVADIVSSLLGQLHVMKNTCITAGAPLDYVKPHGAMYNRAARESTFADALAEAIAAFDPTLAVLALSGSELERSAKKYGLRAAREAFIDRAYLANGMLVPRGQEGAVLHDPSAAADRAVTMVRDGTVISIDGRPVHIAADSLCVHADSRNAAATVLLARARLELAGFAIRSFAE